MKKVIDWIALILVVVGGLNWGLVGALKFNLVSYLFGATGLIVAPIVEQVVYILVGVAAIYTLIVNLSKCCPKK